MRAALVVAALGLVACDGIGRPIVGDRALVDAGDAEGCEVGPTCRAPRPAPPGTFDRPALERAADCDGDGVVDELDSCPGVPNPSQDPAACRPARDACARLRAGLGSFVDADLRGCDAEAPLSPARSFAGADLTCARLRFVPAPPDRVEEWGPADRVDLAGAVLHQADVEVRAPVRIGADGMLLRRATLTLSGGAALEARGAILRDAVVRVERPFDADGAPSPAVQLTDAMVFGGAILEEASARPGRVRIDRVEVDGALLAGPSVEVVGGTLTGARIDADQLLALGAVVRHGAVRARYGAFAGADVQDLTFEGCDALSFRESELGGVEIAGCPGGLRLEETDVVDSLLGGPLEAEGGLIRVSVVGAAALSTLGTDFEDVTFCDQGPAVFRGGDLRCVRCGPEEFGSGDLVCLDGTRLVQRGCGQLEQAPDCAPGLAERLLGP